MKTVELTCISCPLGCAVSVEMEASKVVHVTGNTCKRGEIYATKEVTNPTRIVTTTIPVKDGDIEQLSVKTKQDIPKDKIFECIKELRHISLSAPIEIGDIILEDVARTGVSVVATKKVCYNAR